MVSHLTCVFFAVTLIRRQSVGKDSNRTDSSVRNHLHNMVSLMFVTWCEGFGLTSTVSANTACYRKYLVLTNMSPRKNSPKRKLACGIRTMAYAIVYDRVERARLEVPDNASSRVTGRCFDRMLGRVRNITKREVSAFTTNAHSHAHRLRFVSFAPSLRRRTSR